jgi:hypothetical protein
MLRRMWYWLTGGRYVEVHAPVAYLVPAWWPRWRRDEALAVCRLNHRLPGVPFVIRVPAGVRAVLLRPTQGD